ncbi:hypothetical protein EV356DRAFT_497245 [Viridothelium virens]|uniref:Uncharacterized protein n=1 Tax=Viridothelium virens TaxID=1048519 RepID=A0A6A6HFT3_VIRVR|nr:hypothetical protein EV356DRAFT_497245 [Viridothelium virens]
MSSDNRLALYNRDSFQLQARSGQDPPPSFAARQDPPPSFAARQDLPPSFAARQEAPRPSRLDYQVPFGFGSIPVYCPTCQQYSISRVEAVTGGNT